MLTLLTSFQVYRCRIVWDSRRAIIIPSILWLATLGEPYFFSLCGVRFNHRPLNQAWGSW